MSGEGLLKSGLHGGVTNALFKLIWSPSGRIRFTFFGSLGLKLLAAFNFVALRFEVQSKIVFRS